MGYLFQNLSAKQTFFVKQIVKLGCFGSTQILLTQFTNLLTELVVDIDRFRLRSKLAQKNFDYCSKL